ncbi:hypothetical protein C8J56DRAFT_770321 [Mycena floridula]|nr:hypothetical protein C8J56DRAFT_770321 [Mycena floridula]
MLIFVLATSTHTERSFSAGSTTVSRFRHSLSAESVRAATVLGSWNKEGFVPWEEIIKEMKQKGPRWRIEEPTTSE